MADLLNNRPFCSEDLMISSVQNIRKTVDWFIYEFEILLTIAIRILIKAIFAFITLASTKIVFTVTLAISSITQKVTKSSILITITCWRTWITFIECNLIICYFFQMRERSRKINKLTLWVNISAKKVVLSKFSYNLRLWLKCWIVDPFYICFLTC